MPRIFPNPASRRMLAVILAAALPVLPSVSAHADEPLAASYELPTMVVSPTRLPTPEKEVASSITIITGQQIEEKQQRTLPAVLQDVPAQHRADRRPGRDNLGVPARN
jgi:vitamin B12 transporter